MYFRFLRFSLGLCDADAGLLSGEALKGFGWRDFFVFCREQALLGVAFRGVERLPKEAAPPRELLLKWFGVSEKISRRNAVMNSATAAIYRKITASGFHCCILKGQGNALMYPDPRGRTPGDVDVWVDASRPDLRRLAATFAAAGAEVGKESLNHIELSFDGIAVELHSTPAILNNPLHNSRLQRWLRRNAGLQCSNIVPLPDGVGEVAVPAAAFNVVYQLFHLYHHFLFEGVGLRQFVDYYFAIGKRRTESTDMTVLRRELKNLGLWKFAGAVMYVLHEVLGMAEENMIAPADEKRGRQLLEEILSGGNFGKHDGRYGFGGGALGHNVQRLWRDWRLARNYPAEALCEPLFRVWHFVWRKMEGMRNEE